MGATEVVLIVKVCWTVAMTSNRANPECGRFEPDLTKAQMIQDEMMTKL
eukprot:UN07862